MKLFLFFLLKVCIPDPVAVKVCSPFSVVTNEKFPENLLWLHHKNQLYLHLCLPKDFFYVSVILPLIFTCAIAKKLLKVKGNNNNLYIL